MTTTPLAFELSRTSQFFGALVSVLMVVFGTVGGAFAVISGAGAGFVVVWLLWMGGVLYEVWCGEFRRAHRIEVSDIGLRLVARRRVVDIPWAGLRSVAIPLYDLGRHTLVWRWDGGRTRTWWRYQGLDRLLRIAAERAPEATIRV